jgi:cell wall-associated NlpC family hydrolase
MAAPTVPLARPIILGTKGQDVIAVKRSLSRAGYIKWDSFTDVAGQYCMESVHEFQSDHGIDHAGYGPHTHAKLLETRKEGSKTEWAWDSYSIGLEHAEYVLLHTSPEQRIRSAIVQAARNLYAHRYQIAYTQGRPFALYNMGGPVPTHLDCSGFVIDCYHAAGARCPDYRRVYDGEGYTGTLLAGGKKVADWRNLKAGDLVFYGYTTNPKPAFPYGSPTHVALYDGNGMVYSNGHYPMGHYNVYYGLSINCYVTYNVVP